MTVADSVLIFAAIVVAGILVYAAYRRHAATKRRERLRLQFGPELELRSPSDGERKRSAGAY